MKITCNIERATRLTPRKLAMTAVASLALALGLSACENVAGFTQPSLVRVIDASYIAQKANPSGVNVYVEGTLLAGGIGEGTVTGYGTLPASNNAVINVTAATTNGNPIPLVTSNATLLGGQQHSIFLTDNGAATNGFTVRVIEDLTSVAGGHSAFRFLNEAPRTGDLDVYIIPTGSTLANAIAVCPTDLALGNTCDVSFTSQTVTMVITPHNQTTPQYASTSLALTGGEVRTVLIVDSQLTSDPPVFVVVADDVN